MCTFEEQTAELCFIKERVRELEVAIVVMMIHFISYVLLSVLITQETTKKLNSKVRRQEILELKWRTETPSSALESASDISPLAPKLQRKPSVSNLSAKIEVDIEDDMVMLFL